MDLLIEAFLEQALDSGKLVVDHLLAEEDDYGFEPKSTLNPSIWDGDRLHGDIRSKLIEVVENFLEDDRKLVTLKDIVITGSIANYNWSSYSDVDLHIVVDYGENEDIKKAMFDYKRSLWNEHHKVQIKGFPVEIYVQSVSEPHYSSGVYSVLKEKWVVTPSQIKTHVDVRNIKNKANVVAHRIDLVGRLVSHKQYHTALRVAKDVMDKIKRQRKAGLEAGGEMSVENLAFKLLRRRGDIERLIELRREAFDYMASMDKDRT